MANFFERVQNVFDDHQDRQRQHGRENGYQEALYQTRDALLSSALAVQQEWREELARNPALQARESVNSKYEARLAGLNDAFAALRQAEPGITTQIEIDSFRESVNRHAQERNAGAFEIRNSALQHGVQLSAFEAPQAGAALNADASTPSPKDAVVSDYQRGYEFMRQELDRHLARAEQSDPLVAESIAHKRQVVHDLALRASQDVRDNWGDRGRGPERLESFEYDRGQRKALMDWSHEHNHALLEQGRSQTQSNAKEAAKKVQDYGITY